MGNAWPVLFNVFLSWQWELVIGVFEMKVRCPALYLTYASLAVCFPTLPSLLFLLFLLFLLRLPFGSVEGVLLECVCVRA